jgi:anaerobic selenocysteine-containing dehydrogenase
MDGFLNDVVYSPDRLLYPLKRVGPKGEARFERVSWDAALDDVASRMKQVLREGWANRDSAVQLLWNGGDDPSRLA